VAKGKAKGDPSPVIYVDTCVWVDLLTERDTPHPDTQEPRWKSAKALFSAVDDGRVILAASSLLDAEVSCFSRIRDGSQDVQARVRGLLDSLSTRYAEVDRLLAQDAVQISRTCAQQWPQAKQPNPADAVHMAAAARLGCDYLITQDGEFPIGQKIQGVEIRRTEILWTPTLEDVS
jgi:predicted nucleic acid-binding protein